MRTFTIAGVTAFLMSLATFNVAFAYGAPAPISSPVPELNPHIGIGVIALLISLVAILYRRRTTLRS